LFAKVTTEFAKFPHYNLEAIKAVMNFVLQYHHKFPSIEIFHILLFSIISETNEILHICLTEYLRKESLIPLIIAGYNFFIYDGLPTLTIFYSKNLIKFFNINFI
jgi:hypothetical protein